MNDPASPPPKGRGTGQNPTPRYARQARVSDPADEPATGPRTVVSVDATRSVITRNDSPDLPFNQSLNPYRGCEHGCIYCFARPSHAYLDLSPGLDFETRILAKPRAAQLLADALRKPGYRCQVLAMGTNTDPYQPAERNWRITRSVLELLLDCRHPVAIVTKSARVCRDIDLLAELARQELATVFLSVTTLDADMARTLEPRAAAPQARLDAIARLAQAGVPVGVLVSPIVPALTDHELERILEAAHGAGARFAGFALVRLPGEVAALFEDWLTHHQPLRAGHVMNAIRASWRGELASSEFGERQRGHGPQAQLIAQRFTLASRRLGLGQAPALSTQHFRPPAGGQLGLGF
ncbi:MAG: PA0069 family radical SAM protein [Immundisolibacter sp.]|uniref:PA0069 family radical SAM protein n=1 Tax=Immundisolibacter sp. TaxID=1934948 RepID=UPI00198BE209|nr:PA0069 family radical SAM protein [Immundisolibacter sp.]MBC7160860.1 PA0069 family radical SAM protein [Immundisolibacter sp.]